MAGVMASPGFACGLPAIARTVGGELHCQVGIYDTQGVLVASHGGRSLTVLQAQ